MHWPRLFALASMISPMISKICADQPRITVWLLSSTRDRPLRSSSSLSCRPVLMMPIRVATMKMPPSVTVSIATTNGTLPTSPPMVPGSSVRSRLRHISSGRSKAWVMACSRRVPEIATSSDTMKMKSSEMTNRPTISATVPRDMKLSKA